MTFYFLKIVCNLACIGNQTQDKNCEHCQCGKGFDLHPESGCVDIDECATSNGGCDPLVKCFNVAGSRRCAACPVNYFGYGDDRCFGNLLIFNFLLF